MSAYEFKSVVSNDVMLIPEEYRGLIRSDMRVIVIDDERERGYKKFTFSALQLKTKGVKFDREAANER